MRILLTGTGGQVGGALRPLLAQHGTILAPVVAQFDLSRPDTLARRLDEFEPDLIVNPAAYTAVDRAEDERGLAFLINAEGPAAIAEWAARSGVPLVHFSTDYVFDGSGEKPWREDSPAKPLSVYGESKLAGDTAIAVAGGPHLILRTSWVYSAHGANFVRTVARLARERQELRIVSDQIGAPTAANAIAVALLKILQDNIENLDRLFAERTGVINVVCAGETSWHGFASVIVEGLRSRGVTLAVESILPIKTSEFSTKAKRPTNSRLDISRLQEAFGVTMPPWEQVLQRELDLLVGLG